MNLPYDAHLACAISAALSITGSTNKPAINDVLGKDELQRDNVVGRILAQRRIEIRKAANLDPCNGTDR